MKDQSCPKTLKSLHGFLDLFGAYGRKFVQSYGKIVAPLTSFLVIECLYNAVEHAFHALKQDICTTIILATLEFTNAFILECHAFDKDIGVVLMREGCPLVFTNKQLCDKNLGKSLYEKEMMAAHHAIYMWCPYLIGSCFHVNKDHCSMKYLLKHCLSSLSQ